MKYKHTLGKWKYEFESISGISPKGHFNIKAGSANTTIAMLPLPLWGELGGCKQEANARLMASAPKMIELLEKFVQLTKHLTNENIGDRLYPELVLTYADTIKLLEEMKIDKNTRNKSKRLSL